MVPTLTQVNPGFQNVAYTGTAGTSTPVQSQDPLKSFMNLRLVATSDCYYLIVNPGNNLPSTGIVATATVGSYLPAFQIEYIRVPDNATISVIQVAAAGTLNISVMRDITQL